MLQSAQTIAMQPTGSWCTARRHPSRSAPAGGWHCGASYTPACRRADSCTALQGLQLPASSTLTSRQQGGLARHRMVPSVISMASAYRQPVQCISCSYSNLQRAAPWRAQQHSWQPCSRRQLQSMQLAAAGSFGDGQSVDGDEQGDSGVTRELEAYEVERFRQMGRHLDLMWNVGKKPRPSPCDCCNGTGERKCRYCNSTGAMMVGHERFCSLEQGCKPCPICNGTGEVKCSHCQGTGYRAGWLERGCPVEQ